MQYPSCFQSFKKVLSGAFFVAIISGCATTPRPQMAVASAHPEATQAAMRVMQAGGNAFDAAIAATATLAVVEPFGSGIGGGGFFLFYSAEDDRYVMIDAREKAPSGAHKDLYWNEELQKYDTSWSLNGPLAAGIPGIPAAFDHIAKHYGALPLSDSLADAIRLAAQGFPVYEHYQKLASFRQGVLNESPEAAAIFLQDGEVPPLGAHIVQTDLAATLEAIAHEGAPGFYSGMVADKLIEGVTTSGGIWTHDDLLNYQVVEREPIRGTFYDWEIVSAAPPSSGGIVLAQALKMLEMVDIKSANSDLRTHLAVEAMRRAYRDRAEFLGDADFVEIPIETLLSNAYLAEYAASIEADKATPNEALPAVYVDDNVGEDTTHFSVVDAEGNMASVTLSINYPFGAGFVPPGTGVLLNNEMDDFATHPGVPNAYGLVGGEANAIAPGKRPLSSMSPTFILTPTGKAVLGTPGGSRIISMVLLAILEMQNSADPQVWVSLPRYHHQYLPNAIQYEEGLISQARLKYWQSLGHELKPINRRYGNMHALWIDRKTGILRGASDPRGIGETQVQEK